jgi:hypothetical protein
MEKEWILLYYPVFAYKLSEKISDIYYEVFTRRCVMRIESSDAAAAVMVAGYHTGLFPYLAGRARFGRGSCHSALGNVLAFGNRKPGFNQALCLIAGEVKNLPRLEDHAARKADKRLQFHA